MTIKPAVKKLAEFVDDPNYRNHPAVKRGLKTYSQFKAESTRMKNSEPGLRLSPAREKLAKECGFSSFYQAQRFYRKFQPKDYAHTKLRKKKDRAKLLTEQV